MKVKKGLVGGSPGAVLVLVKTPSSGEDCGDDGDDDDDGDDNDDGDGDGDGGEGFTMT